VTDDATVRRADKGLPVRTLQVEVTTGEQAGERVLAEGELLSVGSAQGNDLILRDATVSRYHVELRRVAHGVSVRDCGSTNGTRVGAVRIERCVVPPGTTLTLGDTDLRITDGDQVTLEVVETDHVGGLYGEAPSMRRLMAQVKRAATSDVPVLLVGESGTGKEVIAQALHELSARAGGPSVTVDCGSLLPTLVASELFGHEQGAFTGADRRHIGAFERAHGGTLFLDEIGELPEALQPTLLGVLERRRFRRLGGKQSVEVDVRVVAATHRDLRKEVNDGSFRLDLYYRLAVVTLAVPPLRERPEDIAPLIEHFLRQAGHERSVESLFSASVLRQLQAYQWPGNVRELRNFVDAALAMGDAPQISDLNPVGANNDLIGSLLEREYGDARSALLEVFERRYLERLLERTEGNVSRAAREGRINRSHLNDLLRRHKLR